MATPFMDLELRLKRSDGSAIRVYVNDENWRILVEDDRGLEDASVKLNPPYPSAFLYPAEMRLVDHLVDVLRTKWKIAAKPPSELGGPGPDRLDKYQLPIREGNGG